MEVDGSHFEGCLQVSKNRPSTILPSLKLTWPLKMDGWNTSFLLGWPIFRGYVSFMEGNQNQLWFPLNFEDKDSLKHSRVKAGFAGNMFFLPGSGRSQGAKEPI